MKSNFFVTISFIYLMNFTAQGAISKSQISFIQVGLIHNYHFDITYYYPPSALMSIVENVRPDLICGEAVETKWNAGLAGLFPFENRILEYAGKKVGASFAPVDWRTTYEEAKDVFTVVKKYISEDAITKANNERDKLDNSFEQAFAQKAGKHFFYYLHDEFWKDAGFYHTQSERFFGDAPNGFWYRRNANITMNCFQAAKRLNAKRVLVAYGAEHQYILNALLENMPGAKSLRLGDAISITKIQLKKKKLPVELRSTFDADLSALRKHLETLPPNSPERIELEKKRVPGLEKAIQSLFQ